MFLKKNREFNIAGSEWEEEALLYLRRVIDQ
jgi:hypothetical protein